MIIRHTLPKTHFTKIDRHVFANPKLSDGAVRLYGYMCGLRNGANFSDSYIMKALGISKRALYNRKRELKALDLILIDQLGPRYYILYIGYTGMSATEVKELWTEESDKGDEPDDIKSDEPEYNS